MGNLIKRNEVAFGVLVALLGSIIIALFSMGRTFFTFATETDYIARLIVEAQRLLSGKPFFLQFHPPFYSIVLAMIYLILNDWFSTGLILSYVSSVAVLVSNFVFFYCLAGRYAAWGCLFGMLSSKIFTTCSSSASQDLFFLALYSACFFFAILAFRYGSRRLWIPVGIFLGLALITRTNSPTLLILLVFPLVLLRNPRDRLRGFISVFLACLVVIGSWVFAARLTGSPIAPQLGQANLAMRYFPTEGDPYTIEARRELMSKFPGFTDVIAHDPSRLAAVYVKDFFKAFERTFRPQNLLAFPLNTLALPGLILLFFGQRNRFTILFLIATISQFALLNFKAYEPRFFLFLIPVLSAGMGLCVKFVWENIPKGLLRSCVLTLFIPFVFYGIIGSYKETYRNLHAQDVELKEAVPKVKTLVDLKEGIIVSRKPHIPFYVGARNVKYPNVENFDDFRTWLEGLRNGAPIYIYYGSDENRWRPNLRLLNYPEKAPIWLHFLDQGSGAVRWTLYQFIPSS